MNEKKIIEYQVIAGANFGELSQGVTKMLEQGWQPLGGCVYYSLGVHPMIVQGLSQAMVKYSD